MPWPAQSTAASPAILQPYQSPGLLTSLLTFVLLNLSSFPRLLGCLHFLACSNFLQHMQYFLDISLLLLPASCLLLPDCAGLWLVKVHSWKISQLKIMHFEWTEIFLRDHNLCSRKELKKKYKIFFNFRICTNVLKCRNVLFFYWFHVKVLFYFFCMC